MQWRNYIFFLTLGLYKYTFFLIIEQILITILLVLYIQYNIKDVYKYVQSTF